MLRSSEPRLVILTEGYSDPINAKTATSVLRYGQHPTVAIIDSLQVGKTAEEILGVGGNIPFVANLSDAPTANTLMIGIAPPGGKIPMSWRSVIRGAIALGMDVISGLHDFLVDDDDFVIDASRFGVNLIDIRKNDEHDVCNQKDIRVECLRIHTVGQDCSVGKMVASIEVARALQDQGYDAKFIATGQTGIMIEGDGCPIDCVVGDFISGAIEKQILAQQHHEILVIEGQGSLAHPRYSAVTLGLLHGCIPHGMILCYEVGRSWVRDMPHVNLKSLQELRTIYENTASIMFPSKIIGVAMNSRLLSEREANAERKKVHLELGLPVCDVLRDGPHDLVKAVQKLHMELR
ncbi:DUF1611 domain-containing protein [Bythopirellula goksoeyrii]|uniref:DUF1611 domain-containing protein n=1 Tax=Bythopirellula goksoeyrii TaxID=1400387 RepID=A0A5B9QQQ0_9BACT|nr:DUF1611 domain-containing protein [Bythopirellula goksoeyrii]QEG36293.1 hypothetical protein Pr1d_36050 [Bythopirellula goksoeyrii]